MSHSNARFERTIKRISTEAFWLYIYHKAICGLDVDSIGLDFFRVSLNALKDARLIRLIRILEDDNQTASFWYLVRSNESLIKSQAKQMQCDLSKIRYVADRLRIIRDKTFVHIDKQQVFDPPSLYKAAGITHDEIDQVINSIWRLMKSLYLVVFGKEIQCDNYDGNDIRQLAALRDKSLGTNA